MQTLQLDELLRSIHSLKEEWLRSELIKATGFMPVALAVSSHKMFTEIAAMCSLQSNTSLI